MKKITAFLLALLFILPVPLSVMAQEAELPLVETGEPTTAEETPTQTEEQPSQGGTAGGTATPPPEGSEGSTQTPAVVGRIASIDITAPVPLDKEAPAEVREEDISIIAVVNGQTKTLSAPLEFFMAGCQWKEKDAATSDPVKQFVKGKEYLLTVSIEIFLDGLSVSGSAIRINGENAILSKQGSDDKHLSISTTFSATSNSIAPFVSLEADGELQKEYDGKDLNLIALVQDPQDGVIYSYEWYKDDALIRGAVRDTLAVRNVKDSGNYYCKITAFRSADPDRKEFSTTATKKVSITPHTIAISIDNTEKNLFDPDPEFTYSVLGEVYDTLEGNLTRDPGEEVGTYTILIGTLSFPEEVASNYKMRIYQGTFSILKEGELPFTAVSSFADLSYIVGKNGSKIRINASKGAVAQGAMVSLSTVDAETQKTVSDFMELDVVKSLSVSILNNSGESFAIPQYASLILRIPLTEEEAAYDNEKLSVAFYSDSVKQIPFEVVETGGIKYISVQIDAVGSLVVLTDLEEEVPPVASPPDPIDGEKQTGGVWIWILIGILLVLAGAAIVFTMIWRKKNLSAEEPEEEGSEDKTEEAPAEKKAPAPEKKTCDNADSKILFLDEEPAEKIRVRRIAEELNALPPIPEQKEAPQEDTAEKKEETVPEEKNKPISFEDLED